MLLSFARHSLTPMRNPRVPGSAPALGCRRVRLAPDMSKMPPACGRIFFNSARGGACWCTRGRARSQGPGRCRAFDSPIVPPKVGADRRDARSFRRAAPFPANLSATADSHEPLVPIRDNRGSPLGAEGGFFREETAFFPPRKVGVSVKNSDCRDHYLFYL